jgi:hypothetical protein
MRLRPIAEALIGRPVRLLAALMALGLLLPVPALALTFTSSWQAVVSTSGGPTPPTPTFTDDTDGHVDNLLVNMGAEQASKANSSSTIELTRTFSLDASEKVEFEERLRSEFQNAGATATVSVKDATGKTVVTPINISVNNTSDKLKTLGDFDRESSRLAKGSYTLDVKVHYFTNNKVGAWKSISTHHQFEFEGEGE